VGRSHRAMGKIHKTKTRKGINKMAKKKSKKKSVKKVSKKEKGNLTTAEIAKKRLDEAKAEKTEKETPKTENPVAAYKVDGGVMLDYKASLVLFTNVLSEGGQKTVAQQILNNFSMLESNLIPVE